MNEREFHVACAILDDDRKLIAAGKSQRWDVIKWGVTVNVALATASIIAVRERANAGKWLFWFALIVAAIAWLLMLYYNHRMTNVRSDAEATENYLASNDVNFTAIKTGRKSRPDAGWLYDWAEKFCLFTLTTITRSNPDAGWLYDREELCLFTLILLISVVPTFVVWMVLGH